MIRVGPVSGSGAAEDEAIGSSAFPGVTRLVLQGVTRGKRGAVFHIDIGKDADFFRADFPTHAKQTVGDALEDPLVGHPGPDEHIDPDKIGAGGLGHGQGPDSIVSEEIDAERAGEKLPGLNSQGGHGGKGGGRNGSGMEGCIPKVLHDHPVSTASFKCEKILGKFFAGFRKLTLGVGRAGQGGQMDDPDKRGVRVEK